jgi:DNA invertase Pin-like site-specific DNA recombinase
MVKESSNKAVGYVRVSTQEQARNGISPADQEQRIRDYCSSQNLELVGIYTDNGVSGATPLANRPGGAQLVVALENRVDCLVALKLDRLFRNVVDCLGWVELWENANKALHLLDFGGTALNTKTAMGKAFLTINAAFGELERSLARERICNAMERKCINGEWHGGPAPFGYVYSEPSATGRGGTGVLIIDEAEATVVREVFTLRAQRMSDRDIATAVGTYAVNVSRILKRRTYCAERDCDGEIFALDVPAIISKELFTQVA